MGRKESWFIAMKKANFQEIADKFHISPISARIIRNRDVVGDENIDSYLNGTIADLYDGMFMQDMDKAVDILIEKIHSQSFIRVIGDYDIDGVNGTYILQEGLAKLGARVDTDIPDRIKDGYGLNRLLIERAVADGVDTVITCDNGIAAADEIAYGKALGLTIIVTDHHKVPHIDMSEEREYLMPQADAVVDPQRPDCAYPFKGLCGAAVAYKLIETLFEVMDRDSDEIDYLMENVAMATIGDVMDLLSENRIFVKQGLEMLRRTSNLGLQALMQINEIEPGSLSAYHIGFVIGPCINAGGRLDTAKKALHLLNAKDKETALAMAAELKALNDARKELTLQGVEEAIALVESTSLTNDKVLVIYLPDCHESIAGIIAGRVREQYCRPVFILTDTEDGVKGSGRSIEAYPMFDEMCKCRTLFTRFGGHKLAAGLSLPKENVDKFRKIMNEMTELTEADLVEKISIDMVLPFQHVSFELVKELKKLEPFGKGNVTPLFAAKDVQVENPGVFGAKENVLKFQGRDAYGVCLPVVYFGQAKECLAYLRDKDKIAMTFYPQVNVYCGETTLQLVMKHYQ
ncbi:MAG: single-stranded-DNA-specific exonuclease RecJ [Lachnospiraceae bacterium]|nr:single-stranded-DNA-specific exonuclease RecJ [Lachnospiraceae bacterium]